MVDPSWLAGGQYLYNLLVALKTYTHDVERVLRVSPGTPPESYKILDGLFDRVLEFPLLLPSWINGLPARVAKHLMPYFLREDETLRQNHIDAQFVVLYPGTARQIPSAT